MRENTYGGSGAAVVLVKILDELPASIRQTTQRRVSHLLHKYFRGLRLLALIPDRTVRETVVRLWRVESLRLVDECEPVVANEGLRTHLNNVIVTAAVRVLRGRETQGPGPRVEHGAVDAPDDVPTTGFLISGTPITKTGDVNFVAVSPAHVRGTLGAEKSRFKNFPEILDAAELWAENAYPGEQLQLPGTVVVALAGDVTEMRSMYKELQRVEKTRGKPAT